MATLDDAKKFANTVFGPKYQQLVRQRDIELSNAAARNAARGTISSGGMAKEAAEIYSNMILKTLHAKANALLEGMELHGVHIDDANDSILEELEQLKADLVRTSSEGLQGKPYLKNLGLGAYLSGEMEGAGSQGLSEVRADIERKRLRKGQPAAAQNVTNVYHVYGHSPRWNTNSTDNSINVVSISQEEIFAALKQEIVEKIQDGEERSDILQRLDALAKAQGTSSFADRYSDFIITAANYMTIIGPFIPALSELLKKALALVR